MIIIQEKKKIEEEKNNGQYNDDEFDFNLIKDEDKKNSLKKNEMKTYLLINPLASPSAGAPAFKYGDVNTVTPSPGEVKGLIIFSV